MTPGAEISDTLAGLLRPDNAAPGQAAAWISELVAPVCEPNLIREACCRLDARFTDTATSEAPDRGGIGYLGRLRDCAALDRHFDPHRCLGGPGRPAERARVGTAETAYSTA